MTLNEYGDDPKEIGLFVSGSLDEYGVTVFGTSEPVEPPIPAGSVLHVRVGGAWAARTVKVRVGGTWVERGANILGD